MRCPTDASPPRHPTPEELANTEPFILIADQTYGRKFRLGALLIALALVTVLASIAFAGH